MPTNERELTPEIQPDAPVSLDDMDIDDDIDDTPSVELTKSQAHQKNIEARRKLEAYLESRNLENEIRDTFSFDDD